MNPPLSCLAPCTPHSSQTRCPDQFAPQFPIEGSEFLFLEAIYSQCTAIERTGAGASKEGPHGFYISSLRVQKSHSSSVFISWVPLSIRPPGSQAPRSFLMQGVSCSQPLASGSSHPEPKLQPKLNLHTELPALNASLNTRIYRTNYKYLRATCQKLLAVNREHI